MKNTHSAAVTSQAALTDSPRFNAMAANENAPRMASAGHNNDCRSLFIRSPLRDDSRTALIAGPATQTALPNRSRPVCSCGVRSPRRRHRLRGSPPNLLENIVALRCTSSISARRCRVMYHFSKPKAHRLSGCGDEPSSPPRPRGLKRWRRRHPSRASCAQYNDRMCSVSGGVRLRREARRSCRRSRSRSRYAEA